MGDSKTHVWRYGICIFAIIAVVLFYLREREITRVLLVVAQFNEARLHNDAKQLERLIIPELRGRPDVPIIIKQTSQLELGSPLEVDLSILSRTATVYAKDSGQGVALRKDSGAWYVVPGFYIKGPY